MIENLGATQVSWLQALLMTFADAAQNQFDAINLSDNEIKKLDNFPNLPRLTTLNIVNNHISKIADELGSKMPALDMLLLTSNRLTSFAEVLGLAEFDKLNILSYACFFCALQFFFVPLNCWLLFVWVFVVTSSQFVAQPGDPEATLPSLPDPHHSFFEGFGLQ